MMTESERLFGLMSRIVKDEGFLALWKGGWPSILKTVPATAITFAVYEMCKTALLTMRETELLQLTREGAIAGSNQ